MKWFKRLIGCAGVVFLGLLAIGVIGAFLVPNSSRSTTTSSDDDLHITQLPQVTPQEVFAAYEANEVRADAAYKGKRVLFTGVIDSIGKDILGAPYVTMLTGDGMARVQLVFPRSKESDLIALSKGSYKRVACKIDGYLVNVIARECELD